MSWPLERVVSGLQTGADQAGLFAAEALGVPTGGWCTRDCRTEAGPAPELAARFGVTPWPTDDYAVRTLLNVKEADGTVIFGDVTEPGSAVTARLVGIWKGCERLITNPTHDQLRRWIELYQIHILNVAGNRLSTLGVGGYNAAVSTLLLALRREDQPLVDPETLWLRGLRPAALRRRGDRWGDRR